MKQWVVGAVLGTVLVVASCVFLGQSQQAWADRTTSHEFGAQLITLTAPVGDARQQVTVVDPKMRVMTVYHVELATGDITLKCVRNIHWDLQMEYFNGASPLPREIRTLLESK